MTLRVWSLDPEEVEALEAGTWAEDRFFCPVTQSGGPPLTLLLANLWEEAGHAPARPKGVKAPPHKIQVWVRVPTPCRLEAEERIQRAAKDWGFSPQLKRKREKRGEKT